MSTTTQQQQQHQPIAKPTGLQPKTVSLSYYAAGRHQIISFDTSSPDFRLAIKILNEQRRPFRIIYN